MTSEEWNKKYPVGTKVRYFPIKSNLESFTDSETVSDAWDVCGTPVVSISGGRGGMSLDHITVL
jgi:hypothetical protein